MMEVRIDGPEINYHHAFNFVGIGLSSEEKRRFASLASRINLSTEEFIEMASLYQEGLSRSNLSRDMRFLSNDPRSFDMYLKNTAQKHHICI